MNNKRVGVILLQMGGPDTLDDIPSFLYNLFSDRDIIKLGPAFLQKPIARLISRRRAPKSTEIYRKIGGGSPLKDITCKQGDALQEILASELDCCVEVAMRYWQPTADQAIRNLLKLEVGQIIALPLYPHYTRATSGSSLKDLRRAHIKLAPHIPLAEIPSWPTQNHYIDALAQKIQQAQEKFAGDPFTLVYSAHSLPVSFIEAGDPYVDELGKTIESLEQKTGISGVLCYQSRSGPVEWLSPSTSDMLETLAEQGCRNILMVPISFVSDHVETLYEINMLFREKASDLGMRLLASDSLNTDPLFIKGLKELVISRLN